jgi:hypothetical protein
LRDSTATGVSVPIEPTASWPVTAIGAIRQLQVLLRVAEGLLAIEQRSVRRGAREPTLGRSSSTIWVRPSHLRYGLALASRCFSSSSEINAALLQVDEQHLSGLEAATCGRIFSAGTGQERRPPRP